VDPFKTAGDVYLEKTGLLIDDSPDAEVDGRDAKYLGNRLEDSVLDYAQDVLGALRRNVPGIVKDTPIRVNTDAIVVGTGNPVEAKTTRIVGFSAEEWGDEGTDRVPARVIVQAHAHMLALGAKLCHVPVLIGGRGFAMFEIPYSDKLAGIIIQRSCEFWNDHVVPGVPPDSIPHLETVKLLKREPDKIVGVDPALVQAWLEAKEAARDAKKRGEEAEAALLNAMGDAEAALCGELGAITYFTTSRKGYTVDPCTYRQLRHKPKGL
jgi:predicted phage-related endonuclease